MRFVHMYGFFWFELLQKHPAVQPKTAVRKPPAASLYGDPWVCVALIWDISINHRYLLAWLTHAFFLHKSGVQNVQLHNFLY